MTLKALEVNQTLKNRKENKMDNNEILVAEQVTENVEPTTTEETVENVEQVETPAEKTYTQSELNDIVGKRLARNTAKIRKEYEKKYGELENVLKAGTGKDDLTEVTDTFRNFYKSKGIDLPTEPKYSSKDIEVLAKAEANDIINAGFDDVTEELDRLTDMGLKNMTEREKAVYRVIADYHKNAVQGKELEKIGVTEDIYGSNEFKEFASQFNSNTPITKIYEIYSKTQPKKEIQTMGSMKNSTQADTGVKEFYTRDEALKFTKKDYDNNPALFKAVEQSMLKW
jgi:hypothetical protein